MPIKIASTPEEIQEFRNEQKAAIRHQAAIFAELFPEGSVEGFHKSLSRKYRKDADFTHSILAFVTGWTSAKGLETGLGADDNVMLGEVITEYLAEVGFVDDSPQENEVSELLSLLMSLRDN